MGAPESTPPAHLILIIDLSPTQWQLSASSNVNGAQGMDLLTFMSQVLVFVNSHLACRQENSVAILGAFPLHSLTLYPSSADNARANIGLGPEAEANTYHGFRSVDDLLMDKIQSELAAMSELDAQKPIALVPSLTQALCQINRLSAPQRKLASDKPTASSVPITDSRILILSVSPDASTPYIPFMNCIFSAQKLRVPIDVCRVFGPDTIFLQQAAYLTGGCYLNLDSGSSLLQSLTMCFLPSASLRNVIELPSQGKVDFRASCFCHKEVVDMGYVCSVCLSIFCKPVVVCATCKIKFPIASYKKMLSATAVTKLNAAAVMSTSPVVPRFKCKHCGIQFTKRSNWTRHESNVNVHRKPPRRRPGTANIENTENSGSSTSPGSSSSSRVQSAPVREPEGLSTRRRSKAAEAAQKKQDESQPLKLELVHDAPPTTGSNPLKITIRASRRKRQRLSTSTECTIPDVKPAVPEVAMPHPDLVPISPVQSKRHRPPHLDERNSQFKKWVRVIRRARWIPGETAPGTPNPLPRQIVRQRAREYAANGVSPGSKPPESMDSVYDVDWEEALRTFGNSTLNDGASTGPVPIEDLGESSTDSDSSLWDSD
ncbi:hypothetical protein OPQ81_005675 [Rhizoctonia solani]|nr:hypothetical protein OPQ81_005675 [Rhizoctonia solani]